MHCEAIQLGHCGASVIILDSSQNLQGTWDLSEVGDQTYKFKTSAIWLCWPKECLRPSMAPTHHYVRKKKVKA